MINTPLTLGNDTYPNRLIQAPLAGISCAPFRLLTWQLSQPAYTCTEMLSCKTLIHSPAFSLKRYIALAPDEGPVCFQLSGNQPHEVALATQIATDAGASLIDLNCGCPVKKIRGKGAGSRLLSNPSTLFTLIQAMKSHTHLPISVKIRVQSHFDDMLNREIAKVVRESGADMLIVHGRHWTQHYETPVQYDQIAYFADELTIPVIGNGDVACLASLKRMLETGCDGVMIGRASVGQPWLIKQLKEECAGKEVLPPSPASIGRLLLDHIHGLIALMGNEKFAILQARQFAKYYARGLSHRLEFMQGIQRADNLTDLTHLIVNTFHSDQG